ncbi:NUDIX domain-containing protein [Flavobacterium sp. JLP]|uniref:NUDIX hydrolase n=1 Tax=unclassified Flavobacterium TaxID=196869 RepID=UPI00188AB744|nr:MULTISPECIES: NUDIX domain-containing protein [unclassified Flavobacterium]MBF4491591.1 NUDIX domain-containing protein [Flavobacterium sp. MR2016-29]MBF4505615.1 NUDIX domain-containing protein [Flavobacterium sp. JLP]
MYKVFVNDKPLFLTNEISKETDFQLFLLESIDIEQLIVKMFQNKIQKACLYHPDESEIMKTLKAKIPVNKAGGGFVYNKKGEVLFIFRNGKWDLPKGGIEKGEDIEATAMREVEEETGVNQLRITHKLQKTYHVFKRNGKYKLKITHWFEMQSDFEGTPQGQIEEGIEKVAWLNPEQIKEALKNSYENIKLLFAEKDEVSVED